MAAENTLLVVNELLAYVFHRYNSDTGTDLQNEINLFYTDDDVSEAKTLFHKHYEAVIGKKKSRQDRGLQSLKYKEVDDILTGMKILDESGPDRPVVFVAINLTNLPGKKLEDPVDINHRVKILELQMVELLTAKTRVEANMAAQFAPTAPTGPTRVQPEAPQQPDAQPKPEAPQRPEAHPRSEAQLRPDVQPQPEVQSGPELTTAGVPGGRAEETKKMTFARVAQRAEFDWKTVQRYAKYGKRKSNTDGQTSIKAAPRRHDFVLFDIDKETSKEDVKKYISENGVDVLSIYSLSKEHWNNQKFRVVVLQKYEERVADPEFWPEQIGYRPFLKKQNQKTLTGAQNGGEV